MILGLKLYLKNRKPTWKGFWFKLLFASKKLQIGKRFKCDSWPDISITDKGKIIIQDDVYLRRSVELRVHGDATINLKGNNRIDRGVRLLAANKSELTIGEGSKIGLYSVLNGGDSITLGKNVLLSGFVYLQTSMHNHEKEIMVQNQGYSHAPIILEDDTWCGAHVVVFPGVTMKQGSIAGSNAVVNTSIDKNVIVGGVPAKQLKLRQ